MSEEGEEEGGGEEEWEGEGSGGSEGEEVIHSSKLKKICTRPGHQRSRWSRRGNLKRKKEIRPRKRVSFCLQKNEYCQ